MNLLIKFFSDAIKVISNPVGFYRDMPRKGGFVEPILFFTVMSIVGSIIELLMLFGWRSIAGVFDLEPDVLFYLISGLSLGFVFAILMSFFLYGILFVIWKLMGSKESYETSFRCGAYSTAIVPILTLMAFNPIVYAFGGFFWYFYLVITASEKVHEIQSEVALFGFLIIFVFYWSSTIYLRSF